MVWHAKQQIHWKQLKMMDKILNIALKSQQDVKEYLNSNEVNMELQKGRLVLKSVFILVTYAKSGNLDFLVWWLCRAQGGRRQNLGPTQDDKSKISPPHPSTPANNAETLKDYNYCVRMKNKYSQKDIPRELTC